MYLDKVIITAFWLRALILNYIKTMAHTHAHVHAHAYACTHTCTCTHTYTHVRTSTDIHHRIPGNIMYIDTKQHSTTTHHIRDGAGWLL